MTETIPYSDEELLMGKGQNRKTNHSEGLLL